MFMESGSADGDVGAPRASAVLVCTHATIRIAVEKFGVEVFDERLIAVDEFHHVSTNPGSRLGDHVRQLRCFQECPLPSIRIVSVKSVVCVTMKPAHTRRRDGLPSWNYKTNHQTQF